jgi:hypothetical protein
MASSFKAQNIFGSGPHRFRVMAEGELIVPNSRLNPLQPGSTPVGQLELTIEVTGRLVSTTEAGLWTIRDVITALLAHPPILGTLADHHARSWTNMSFVRFQTGDRTDRGRTVSIPYIATFMRFL